ncbi:DUF1956 domain-containing protein, partial [Mesorhizobium sp. M7A.F.Ca.CA.004.12.1.1]
MVKLPEPKILRREPAEMTRAALVQ